MSTICELAGIIIEVVPNAFTSVISADCAITTNPVFVPAPSLIVPALTGPENVVVPMSTSL
jgi:hypothetical protein